MPFRNGIRIGEDCFLAIRSTLYSATLAEGVWVGMAALIMRATLDAHTYVPAGSVIRSQPDAIRRPARRSFALKPDRR